jgi:hypothetical protein
MIIGVARNPYSVNVPSRLTEAATKLGIPIRIIDLLTLAVAININGEVIVRDAAGCY